jgi:cobaltochelatase CobN
MFHIVVVLSGSEPIYDFIQAEKTLNQAFPEDFQFDIFDTMSLDEDEELFERCCTATECCDISFIKLHGSVAAFKNFLRYRKTLKDKKFFFHCGIEDEISELTGEMNLYSYEYAKIYQYYKFGGVDNIENMIRYIAVTVTKKISDQQILVPEPIPKRQDGLHDERFIIKDEKEYLQSIMESSSLKIGLLINGHTEIQNDYEYIDALMRVIRNSDALPVAVYSQLSPDDINKYGGVEESFRKYFMKDGKTYIDALINLSPFSISILASPGNGSSARAESIFKMLDIPVLQGMTSYYNYEKWCNAPAGIPPSSLSCFVYQPEFDGQIITYPIAYTEKKVEDDRQINVSMPIEERVERLVRLAINWAQLRHISMNEKKIAILFHNLPPRNDMIGCASGLDSPESVFRMVQDLKKQGFKLDYDFQDGEEIINKIIAGVTNDERWSSEKVVLEKSIDTVSLECYQNWYNGFSEKVHYEMERDWGLPPGEHMAIYNKLLIPGIINGNLFIGLQPPRSLTEKAEELVHNTDIVCPHQYIAFYRWIEDVFNADAVIYVGTHGTLEWLPGRDVGLDENSYPDMAIGTLPNLYPYCVSNPGEGAQAKRRSYCTIIDYLIPSMVESGTYDALTDLDCMMKEYYHFQLADPQRLPDIRKCIWETAVKSNLTVDLGLCEQDAMEDIDGCIDKLHAWVSRIQSSEISDGLHVFGMVPEGERKRNLIKVLVRVKNGEVPSLREGLCEAAGVELDTLLNEPAYLRSDGKTNAILLEELDETGRRIFEMWESLDYRENVIDTLLENNLPKSDNSKMKLKECLRFVASEIVPRVEKTENELLALRNGINGKFIEPGPSGPPTRGNAKILPTGRNFYSVEPGAIPTRAAWKVGVELGEQLLARYQEDEGCIPESITMLVYATEAMRTTGDDIAEIFYLLGLKPVWLGGSDRVIGVDVIPVSELGRPRIDITLRITGLFRDTFPNLIERVEDAINLVASLDETHEENYVKKHIDQVISEMVSAGEDEEQAYEDAVLRIFGCPPGTHGAGVKELVYAKKWDDKNDLSDVFTAWSGHAYGKKIHGEKHPQDFKRRLSMTDLVVKNESSIERDMLDSDDFYNYFGGLVAAVTIHTGSQKPSYLPNTSDKDHLDILSIHEEASRVMRARVDNPKWIEGLKKHGYKGAQEIAVMADVVFGWDATTDVIDDWMYSAIADRYVFNKENADWIQEVNLWALHTVAERLLEAHQRDMWHASEEQLSNLKDIYLKMEGVAEETV